MSAPRIELASDVPLFKAEVQRAFGGWRGPAAGVNVTELPNGSEVFGIMLTMLSGDLLARVSDVREVARLGLIQRAIVAYAEDIGDRADVLRQRSVLAVIDYASERAAMRTSTAYVLTDPCAPLRRRSGTRRSR